ISSGEEFILHGVEITDGLSTKVYAPVPDYFYRVRFASGRAFFALIKDGTYIDALTQSPIKYEESYTVEAFLPSTGYFSGAMSVDISYDEEDEEFDEDTDEEEEYIDKPPAFVFTPSSLANAARQQAERLVAVFEQDDNAKPGQCFEYVNTTT